MAIQAQSYQQNLVSSPLFIQHRKNQIPNPPIRSQNEELVEFDQLIRLQTERLSVALQEQRKQHTAALISTIESKTWLILNQKDQELTAAVQRTAQLHSILQKVEMESHAWRRAAEESEAVVASLNNTLEQLSREKESSSTGSGKKEEETGENEVGAGTDPCKICKARDCCVLFLPCRHLCSCKACESRLGFCPVCRTAKKATMEALRF